MEPVWSSSWKSRQRSPTKWISPGKHLGIPSRDPFCQETGVDRNEISDWDVLRGNPHMLRYSAREYDGISRMEARLTCR